MLTAKVFFYGEPVGLLSRTDDKKYTFEYSKAYLEGPGSPISFSLPLQEEPFISGCLHPFFSGLVSEGWLRKMQSKHQRIDEKDEFSLLIHNGKDLSGAIKIEL
jgi:serine/threonine-protein kinase HipA